MHRRVIAALGVLALVAVACSSSSSTPERPVAEPGQIVTIMSSGKDGVRNPYGEPRSHLYDYVAVDGQANVFVDDREDNVVLEVPPKGGVKAVAACNSDLPKGLAEDKHRPSRCVGEIVTHYAQLAADAAGTVYLVDDRMNIIRAITAKGAEQSVAGTADLGHDGPLSGFGPDVALYRPGGPAVGPDGNLYFRNGGSIVRVDRNRMLSTVAGPGAPGRAGTIGPVPAGQLAFDGAGNLYASFNSQVHKIDPSGAITTVAGNGQNGTFVEGAQATATPLMFEGFVVDKAGNIFLALKHENRIVRVGTDGVARTYAGNGRAGVSGDRGPATDAELSDPTFLALDAAGNLFIVDGGNGRIRMVGAERR